jgi:prepilin signal peptidase PulO-like enzyme (type II secretory pathway)
MIGIIVAAAIFGCIATIAAELSAALCSRTLPADDGPTPRKPPIILLVAASALVGAVLVAWSASPMPIVAAAIVVFALVACWCSDARCGIVPDAFTLAPLAALVLLALAQRNWEVLWSAAIPFAFFAGAAMLSQGRGMGWGDAKFVAITGAALGAPLALFALALACVAAVIGQRLTKATRGGPIAFAPYIAAATGIALPFGMLR